MAKQKIHPETYNCLLCNKEAIFRVSKENKYCSIKCMNEYEYNEYIKSWKAGVNDGRKGLTQTSNRIRKYIVNKFNNTCQGCGITETYNGKPISLQLEHIDGNSRNNNESNLSLLCPNCHSQTPFYGSKNKGNGRGALIKKDAGLV